MYLFYEPKIHLCLTLMIYRLRHHKFIITAAPLYLCSSINSLLSHYQFILAAASIHCYCIINLLLRHHQYIVTVLLINYCSITRLSFLQYEFIFSAMQFYYFGQYEFIVLTYVHSIPMNAWHHFTYIRKLRHHYPQATQHRNVILSEGCILFS